jgi:hypothetical protein
MEVPFGLMNMQTTGSIGNSEWSYVKRYSCSDATATFHLPLTATDADVGKVRPEEMFLGWNRTPSSLTQLTVVTSEGYHAFKNKCDIIRTVGNASSMTLKLPLSGWRKYLSIALYTKYRDLLDRNLLEYTYGSLVFGYYGVSGPIKKAEIARLVQIKCLQQVQLAEGSTTTSSTQRESVAGTSVPKPNFDIPGRTPYDD